MKKLCILILALTFSLSAFSAIKLDMEINNQKGVYIVENGQITTLKVGKRQVVVTPQITKDVKKNIMLQFKIFENGRLVSAPKITTLPGSRANVYQEAVGGKEKLNIIVTPEILKK